ncbi:hypothetical protein [Acinetobacter guillouiae]|uniref:phage tail fiber protein n=1 Tax=Acinetobacter guillouiae TaxID=106649 RepID=UPI0028D0114F|nr:hypothetical protein [Acinetobacter guillouiae]
MAIQTINLGTAPSGAGGDTFRSTGTKVNENFTNNTHAASRYVGTAAGNVMEVGAFGLGSGIPVLSGTTSIQDLITKLGTQSKFTYSTGSFTGSPFGTYSLGINLQRDGDQVFIAFDVTGKKSGYIAKTSTGVYAATIFYTDQNTTVDSNGFIKAASPIIKLFADKIESNDEALEQEPVFEKVGIGHYLIKNTEGFSDDGWYIEMPKDANGNVLVAVQYQQLEDNTIEVKTFAKKFDEETGDIVPNIEKPRDIPTGRWIDIRLKALPQPEIEISKTPVDFQPTNLAQAVAEALKDDSE